MLIVSEEKHNYFIGSFKMEHGACELTYAVILQHAEVCWGKKFKEVHSQKLNFYVRNEFVPRDHFAIIL